MKVFRPLLVTVLFFISMPLAAAAADHPLDALNAAEIASAVEVLRAAEKADDDTLFVAITLDEPDKQQVLAWKPGDPMARRARVVMRRDRSTIQAIVDLGAPSLVSSGEVAGVQPAIATPELFAGMAAAIGDPRMQEGLAKRGITDLEQLFCAPRTVGNFGQAAEMTRRLSKLDCFDIRGILTDVFAKPIEGLFATVDLDTGEVIEVTDLGVVPIPPGDSELDPESIGAQREVEPVLFSSPRGSNVAIDGSWVSWQKWSFHLRWDVRAGLIVSMVGYEDDGERRSILYQGSLAEIFVPYQDPTEGWYFRNYMDEGDYGLGTMGAALEPGADCPESAVFVSPIMANAEGGSAQLPNRVCVYERTAGDPIWRHYDLATEVTSSRPGLELVVRNIASVGNYDYAFDWVFDQGGNLTFRGGATGIDSVKGVRALSLADETAQEDTAWGPLVAPGRAGINHDHFFSVRLDLDVDGTANTFVRDRMVAERLPTHSPRRSVWRVQQEVAKTDTEARFRLDFQRPSLWRVLNPDETNALGYPTSYAIKTAGNALPLVDEDDPPLSRALFATYHLWVTPYAAEERYAAGEFPNQSTPGQGLPAWTANGRGIEDQDIVLWYTLGFHHVPSAEDWPVYNLGWHSVTLRPYNFFDHNPALDVPPAKTGGAAR
ncbi:MAG: tyramine oxidase [Acidobacteriota bacterium]|nr:tyramine oxidase [Acidobacteriota bacterium]